MKKHLGFAARGIVFCVILLLLFQKINYILMPKFYYDNVWPTTSGFKGFYQMEEDSIDVLFLGSSHAATQFSPQVLYNTYGIRSYNLGCEQQNLLTSYYWLREALRFQKPRFVILDTFVLFEYINYETLNSSKSCTRKAFDAMKWSWVKWEAIHDICKYDEKQTLASYYFPNIRYHTRWTDLCANDFLYGRLEEHYELKGYAPLCDYSYNREYTPFSGKETDEYDEMLPLMQAYMDRIVALCAEEGITLILVKTPSATQTPAKHHTLCDYAAEKGVLFLDFNEESIYHACGFEFAADMNDNEHGNMRGAEKISRYMASVLYDQYGLGGGEGFEQWKETEAYYEMVYEDYELGHIRDIESYVDAIKRERYTVLLSVRNEGNLAVNEEAVACFRTLGLQMRLTPECSYYAVIQDGTVECYGDTLLTYHGAIQDGLTDFEITSGSENDNGRAECSIKINHVNYAKNRHGLNLVVYNRETRTVVDTVWYDGEALCR